MTVIRCGGRYLTCFSDAFGYKIQIARRKYPAKRTYKQAQTISNSIRFIYNCHKSQIKIAREIKNSLFRNCVKDNIRYAFWMCHMNYMWSINFFLAINETVLFSVLFHDIQSGLIKSHVQGSTDRQVLGPTGPSRFEIFKILLVLVRSEIWKSFSSRSVRDPRVLVRESLLWVDLKLNSSKIKFCYHVLIKNPHTKF